MHLTSFIARRIAGKRSLLALAGLAAIATLVLTSCTGGGAIVEQGWSGPVVDGGYLYMGSRGGKIVSIKASQLSDREPLRLDTWVKDRISSGGDKPPAKVLEAGEWVFPPERSATIDAIYASPVLAGDKLFMGSLNQRIYAFDRKTGAYAWQPYLAKGDIYGTVAVDGDRLVFADDKGYVYAIAAEDGRELWKRQVSDKQFWGSPAVAAGVVYIGGMDKMLYALKAETGDTLWTFKAKGAIASTPLAVGDLIYVGDFEHRFYAIDKNTRRAVAIFEGESWFWNDAIHSNGVIYAGDLSGNFYALDAGTLRLRWRYPAEGSEESKNPIRSKAVIVNDRIFVASRSGAVNALRLDGTNDRTLSFAVEARVLASLGQGDGTVYVSDQNQRVHVKKAPAR